MAAYHLENLFIASYPEPKGQLTRTWVGNFGVTCRSKKAKILRSEIERPIDSKFGRKCWGDIDQK